jgi:D-serine deaminase-like pyridoxal phosphate-dependent protein
MINLSSITRPTLLLDERICRANIAFMSKRAAEAGVHFRPHMKTAQSRLVAGWFRDAGVRSITVSSVGMARYFADDGWDDITIAFPVNPREIDALNTFPGTVRLHFLLESPETAGMLGAALRREADVWIKLDSGYGRTGIPHDDDVALDALISSLRQITQLRLRGLLTHAGMTYTASNADEVRVLFEQSRARLVGAAQRHGNLLCSAGDTPGCTLAKSFEGLHEIRPGNMTFYDLMQAKRGVCGIHDIAVAAACPVVAVHEKRGEVVLYGGAVHLSKESIPGDEGFPLYGLLCELTPEGWSDPIEGGWLCGMSQEHGIARLPAPILRRLKPGDLLAVLPVHSCLTADAFGGYLNLDGERVDHYAAHIHFPHAI